MTSSPTVRAYVLLGAISALLGWLLLTAHVAVAADASTKPAASAKTMAPIDLTGYWVSVIHTDWRWRMMTPERGNYNRAAITPEAKAFADAWDPKTDISAGEQCRAYGAAGLMRMPGRLHISWQDENTLKVEADAGTQTRLLHFAVPPPLPPSLSWQGQSKARWDSSAVRDAKQPAKAGSLHVVTTQMRLGYLLKNGLPYSSDAALTEDWDLMDEPDGTKWLQVVSEVSDPKYLSAPRFTAPIFKREPDGSKWHPTACEAK